MIDFKEISDEERLLRRAVDDALVHYVAKVVEMWIVDPAEQPERAFAGIRKAILVWNEAIRAIEAGEI